MEDTDSKRRDGKEMPELEVCCSNRPIYEITYRLGTKWLVCNECLDLEYFSSDIAEKVRIQN